MEDAEEPFGEADLLLLSAPDLHGLPRSLQGEDLGFRTGELLALQRLDQFIGANNGRPHLPDDDSRSHVGEGAFPVFYGVREGPLEECDRRIPCLGNPSGSAVHK